MSQNRRSKRGLSLVELSIVLSIMGIVGGAIWAAANAVRARQPIQDSVQLVSEIATNVRGVYTGFPNAVAPTLAEQIARRMYPASIVNAAGTDTVNGWGGTVHLTFPAASLSGFSVEFTLPATMAQAEQREACLGMVSRITGSVTGGVATTNTLPNVVPALDSTQGNVPSLVFVNRTPPAAGSWVNVTGLAPSGLFTSAQGCGGFAAYYRL